MNIFYMTPDQYKTKRFGGMGTKTKTIAEAWSSEHYIDIGSVIDPELASLYDVVIIELLGFRNGEKLKERVENLKRMDVPKVVYGSDSELLRWSGQELATLKEIVTLWIPNMEWQGNYFRDFELPVSDVVYEPINTDMFRPVEQRQKVIIAGGAISQQKQSEFFIELFGTLQEMDTGDYTTAYLGGADSWETYEAINFEIEHELKAVTDTFHGHVSPNKVAVALSEAGVGVLNPHYETCNRFDMELMASGVPRVCGRHVCYDERPTVARFTDTKSCIKALQSITNEFTALPDQTYSEEAVVYARENFSYEATLQQLNSILRRII